jgi:hypothetical protein
MAIVDWAFIALGNGREGADGERAVVEFDGLTSRFVVVPDAAAAVAVAASLVASGVQTVELCGAFSPAEVAAVRGVTGAVPVGAVQYGVDSVQGFAALL